MAWTALLAEFSKDSSNADRRGSVRRKLAFESVLTAPRPQAKIVVFDLSEAGLMLHSPEALDLGETFSVVLPEAGAVEAQVMWKRNTLYGCAFRTPVSRATISAVMLKARCGPRPEGGN